MRRQDLLKNCNSSVGLFQTKKTHTVFLHFTWLQADDLLTFRECADSIGTVPLFVCERPQHRMTGLVCGTQLRNTLQQCHGFFTSGFVLNLSSTF